MIVVKKFCIMEVKLLIRKRIANYMEQNGIKQIHLSQKTGISPQAISSLLHGNRNLDVEEYAKICDVLNVPYDYFMPEGTKDQKKVG